MTCAGTTSLPRTRTAGNCWSRIARYSVIDDIRKISAVSATV
jgi:hypothetical protein